MSDKTHGPLTFGFDIGIASVGWCVLGENRIVDLGVRCFDKAETAKEGESLNLARRTARLMRRRLRRRAWRLIKLARLLKRKGLIADVNILKQPPVKGFKTPNLWKLRVEALGGRLTDEEWARVIYHLCKHRGAHWISRAEEKKAEGDTKSESGKVKKGLEQNKVLMKDKGYRTAAEMVMGEFLRAVKDDEGGTKLDKDGKPIFEGRAKNTTNDYSKSLSRVLLSDELKTLFEKQREFGNPHATRELEATILGNDDRKSGLFWEQHPPLSGQQMLDRIGRCTFERSGGDDGKGEYRAPKASFTAERHVWLTRLNNLRIVVDGTTRPLNEEERRIALPLPYKQLKQPRDDFKYSHLRAALIKEGGVPNNFKFAGLSYPSGKQADEAKPKDPEAERLVKLPAWQELRKKLKDKGLETEWESMAGAAHGGDPTLLDNIAWVLSVYKDGDEVDTELRDLNLPGGEAMVKALSEISFDKFHSLSLKALRKIVPKMETGLRYDEAVAAIPEYGHHSQLHKPDDGKELYLPPLYEHARGHKRGEEGRMIFSERIERDITGGIPRNPVVLRALNQARKVCNALIREYGSPAAVHIEMARDLSRPLTGHWTESGKYVEGRRDVEAKQREFRDRNDAVRKKFTETFRFVPKGREFEKYQLYEEQGGKCAYSLETLDINRVINESKYVEIDHALPYSRSYDDSKNNKVLVLTRENQNKGNRTAYEYLTSFVGGEDGDRWRNYKIWVEGNKSYRQAKRNRLLRKNYGPEEAQGFKDRNLNDTRYICKFFKNYVERYLKLSPKVGAGGTADMDTNKRCVVLNGQLTAFLRARWGLLKIREEGDRHHALDAAVIAACSHAMVKRLADHARRKELEFLREGFPDPETGVILNPTAHHQLTERFPEPWAHFRRELETRLKTDSVEELRTEIARLSAYPPEALQTLHPLFISRAPQRRNSGAFHKETIYGENRKEFGAKTTAINRKAVTDLKESDLDKIVGAHEPRNEGLIESLRRWLQSQKALHELVSGLGKGKSKRDPTEDEKRRMDELSLLPRKPLKSDPENGPFTGPIIKRVKLIETRKSGAHVRNGVAELGQVMRTKLYRHGDEFLFLPRYELSDENLFGLTPIPANAVDTGVELYGNDVVRIEHPNLSHCYRAIRTYKDDETGEKLVDVVAAFPSGTFLGYWAYFEPSNNRPVVQLHDSARFFLLEANKETEQHTFTLIAKKKKGKDKDEGDDAYEYLEKSPPMERKPFKFSLEENIKRQIGSAKSFEKLHVDVLGNIYPTPTEQHRGLA